MDETTEESRATDTVTTVEAVTQWLTWITEVERHQPLWQQLEHPNEQYHLHLEATYLAQLPQYHEEEAAAEGGGSSDQDTHMPDADHNLAESGIDITERVGSIIADQQDQHAITPEETIHQLQAPSPQRPPRTPSVRHARNYCEEESTPV